MGEWKRVFSNPRRLAALALIVLLSTAFFLVSRMDYFGRGSATVLVRGERYYADLVSQLRGMSGEDAEDFLADEAELLTECTIYFVWGDEPFGSSKEELEERVSGSPFLSSVRDMEDDIQEQMLTAAQSRVEELQEQLSYVEGYGDYIDKVQAQAALQAQTALFGDKNSFANRNLTRTAAEFEPLRDVKVELGSNRAYEGWVEFELADYLYLLLIILFVFAFLEERKAGLWGVIRETPGGRWRLGLHRVAILFCAAAGGAVLLYGVNLILSLSLSGGWGDMGRSVQSMEIFRTLTLRVTVGEWIVRYMLLKAASGFMVGLLLWCVLGSLSSVQFSLTVLCVVLTGEYALFAFLPVQSIFNFAKYFNLFSYIRTSKLYTDYLNVDLFGYPFGIRRLALGALPVFTAAFLTWAMLLQGLKRPQGSRGILMTVADGWNRCADFFRRRLTVGGWELYKTLIFQKCLPILLVIFLAGGTLQFVRLKVDTRDENAWVAAYLRELTGPVDDYVDNYIVMAREKAKNDAELLAALDQVEAHVEDLRERAKEGGYEPWIVRSIIPYDCVYGATSLDLQRLNAALSVVFIILCCAPLGAFERQSGVVPMLRSLKRGRRGVFVRKLFAALLMAGAVWAAVYGREFWQFAEMFNPVDMAAPIGNFDELAAFPLPRLTMGQVMALIYTTRYVMMVMLAMAVMFISLRVPTVEGAYILSLTLLGLPGLLYALGIDFLRFLSPVDAVCVSEGVWTLAATGSFKHLIPCAILLLIGLAALALNARRSTHPTP